MTNSQDVRARMEKSLDALRRDFSTGRTGKASPVLLDTVRVEAYGSQMPLNQVGTVSAPEPRMLVVQPWDKSQLGAIERAIRDADLGLNPSNDGSIVRVPVPALTEERRREYAKSLHKMAEEARVAVRQIRKDANDEVKTQQKDGDLSEDQARREQDAVQKVTDDYVGRIEELLKHKEAEVMEV